MQKVSGLNRFTYGAEFDCHTSIGKFVGFGRYVPLGATTDTKVSATSEAFTDNNEPIQLNASSKTNTISTRQCKSR